MVRAENMEHFVQAKLQAVQCEISVFEVSFDCDEVFAC